MPRSTSTGAQAQPVQAVRRRHPSEHRQVARVPRERADGRHAARLGLPAADPHAVEIEGEPYWDGGYSANPAVFPLFYECASRDVLLVLLSPLRHQHTPRTVSEIETRIIELAFNANFMREMRMFAHAIQFSSAPFVTVGRLERRLQKMRFHMIDSSQLVSLQRTETRMLAHGPFLELLRDQGRERGAAWLSNIPMASAGGRPSI